MNKTNKKINPVRNLRRVLRSPSKFSQAVTRVAKRRGVISNGIKKATDFQVYLKNQLKNKDLKRYYDEHGKQLEIAYRILQLRKNANLSQSDFAKRLGTTQSNIARMEQGRQNFTIDTLNKVAKTFDKELEVSMR